MKRVTDAESAWLLVCARRLLTFQRNAEAAGETYHDLQPLTDLQCGFGAKLRFVKGAAGQYQPEVLLGPASRAPATDQSLPNMTEIATEILNGAAYYHGPEFVKLVSCHRFGLEKDKTT